MGSPSDIDRISQALSDPRRVQILDLLAAKRQCDCCSPENPDAPDSLCACDLRPSLEGIAPSKLAYHLKQLREAGLVEEQQRGKWVYYTLNRTALEAYGRAVSERWGERKPAAPGRSEPVAAPERAPVRTAPVRAMPGGGRKASPAPAKNRSSSPSWDED